MTRKTLVQNLLILILSSLGLVFCNFYTDKAADIDTCSAENRNCEVKRPDIEDEGPSFIGRDGLSRLHGGKVGHVEEVDLGEFKRNRITRAMKPLMFEIPDFLSDEECDYIITKAESIGMITSIARGGLTKKEDLELPQIESGKAEGAAGIFEVWDVNYDGKITLDEVIQFAKRYFYTIFDEEDMMDLLHKVNVTELDDGYITYKEFENMNTRGAEAIIYVAGKTHPKYRPRYSAQTWINQRYLKDPVLDRVIERVIKLTKLPREIIYGSERLQVVYYDKNGHYHAHFDSETHERTDVPCCHQMEEKQMIAMEGPCKLCRYITILYYLNNVELGGETAFPVADNKTLNISILENSRGDLDYFNLSNNCHVGNLVIKARKGTAIMWYNHLMDEESGWMGARDEYSLHGGCDILQGEKWIANNWITAPYKDGAHIPSAWLNFF